MKCCSIKLANRAKERQSFFQKDEPRCHPAILQSSNNYFRLSSSESTDKAPEDEQPSLSVLNIILPNDIKAFNTGSSIQRWANKRPRLKSAKTPSAKEENVLETDQDSLDVSNLIKELQNECSEEENIAIENEDEEIDPDIQRLLTESNKEETSGENEDATTDSKRISFELEEKVNADDGVKRRTKRRHKKKSKTRNKDKEKVQKSKKKLTKTVSFSLSKPPTPQTEQVIRVDVISNYSVEFDIASNQTDAMISEQTKFSTENNGRESKNDGRFVFQVICTEKPNETKNFILESKKAVLFPRNIEK